MYYGSLGAADRARPKWCPPTAMDPENPAADPCATSYKMKLPVVGDGTFSLPLSQMTNDAMNAAQHWLPNYLPSYYESLEPYIDAEKGKLYAELETWLPRVVDDVLDDVVMPEIEALQDTTVAYAETLRNETIWALLGMTLTLTMAVGASAWWLRRR